LHREGVLLIRWRWRATDLARRHQPVLAAHRRHHVVGTETIGREAGGIEPEAVRQFAVAEIGEAAHPRHSADRIGKVLIQ
jgi:hypothetical protein